MENLYLHMGQANCMKLDNVGTGNAWTNIYCAGGNPPSTRVPLTGAVIDCDGDGGNAQFGNVFNQLNTEWWEAPYSIVCRETRSMVFNSVHIEGMRFIGTPPRVFYQIGGGSVINGMDILDCQFLSGDITGTVTFFYSYDQGDIDVRGVNMFCATRPTSPSRPCSSPAMIRLRPVWYAALYAHPGRADQRRHDEDGVRRQPAGGDLRSLFGGWDLHWRAGVEPDGPGRP